MSQDKPTPVAEYTHPDKPVKVAEYTHPEFQINRKSRRGFGGGNFSKRSPCVPENILQRFLDDRPLYSYVTKGSDTNVKHQIRLFVKNLDRKFNEDPVVYDPKVHDDIILSMASRGYSIACIAIVVGVTRMTLKAWANNNPRFAEVLVRAKEACQAHYERLLTENAMIPEDKHGNPQRRLDMGIVVFIMRSWFQDEYLESPKIALNLTDAPKIADDIKQQLDSLETRLRNGRYQSSRQLP